jgi:uncharacterized heparinase superfamily protein
LHGNQSVKLVLGTRILPDAEISGFMRCWPLADSRNIGRMWGESWRYQVVAKTIAEWIQEGETLYAAALDEYERIDNELRELEKKLANKQEEVNQIAQVIGKPMVEGNRRLTAQLVDNAVPNSPATIARALAGRNLNR